MCGIYGMIAAGGKPLANPDHQHHMRRAIAHRGPDGHGVLTRPYAVLGVNRLRIIDRTARADQPFTDPEGAVWVACNGEIYNSEDIRRQFADYPYRSRADAETILPLYLGRGASGLAGLDGMFAIAIWDERTRTLTLARDRAGEKPLFLTERGGETWFASEIQALLQGARPPVDRAALGDILRLGYPLEPRTIWTGITRIEAGTIVEFGPQGRKATRYWDPWEGAGSGEQGGDALSAEDATEQIATLLKRSVQKQLVADVPVGVFASGGLDSAMLVALAAGEIGGDHLHTFTIRFANRSYDESRFARMVAAKFGTRQVEALANEDTLHGALDRVIHSVGEPITDPAILPTLLLAKTARDRVGVVLSGEGADELFGGYPTYVGHQMAPRFNRLPSGLRSAIIRVISGLPSSYGKVTLEFMLKRFVSGAGLSWFERHVAWFGTGLDGSTVGRFHGSLTPTAEPPNRRTADTLDLAMRWDYATYLRDHLLAKIDRATSLVALESRAPYLDADLTRLAWRLPPDLKVHGLTTKRLLRQVARRWLPGAIVDRRKRGLSVPVAAMLNGSLASAVDRVLAPERLTRQGLLNASAVSQLVAEHRRGRLTLTRGLWTLFVLQLWMEHWMPEGTG